MQGSFDYVRGKTILVTGAAGSVGSALAETLLPHAKSVRAFDNNESELFFLHQRLSPRGSLSPQLGDIRDVDRLRYAVGGADVIFHAAALKHVGLGEYNPFEVVQSNLVGLNNVIRAGLEANVERVIFTSSDKAVNPTNVMGASKMMGERLIAAANEIRGWRQTRFASVRFGNVLGSRGSVVPIFVRQLRRKEPLTLTDAGMTRYVMTIRDAAELVITAGATMKGGEVFVTKMRAVRVVDLMHAIATIAGRPTFETVVTGARSGEKLYEELIAVEERERALDIGRLLVLVPPGDAMADWRARYESATPVEKGWSSADDEYMSREDLTAYLREHEVLTPFLEEM